MGKLFATTVANAKPKDRDYKLTDGEGLYLLVKPSGRKLWRLNYRYLGKQRTLSFGGWPAVSLVDARGQRDEARRMIAAGLDPSHEARLAAAREKLSEENSFKLVAEEWVAKNEREGLAEVTLSKIRWLLASAIPDRLLSPRADQRLLGRLLNVRSWLGKGQSRVSAFRQPLLDTA